VEYAFGLPGWFLVAVTRSTAEARRVVPVAPRVGRGPEMLWLILAALIVSGVWALVYTAKLRRSTTPAPTVNLAEIDRGEKLLPVLAVLQSPADRDFAAKRIFDVLADRDGALPNTGALARIRIPRAELIENNEVQELRKRA
jgi:hypothetical protein